MDDGEILPIMNVWVLTVKDYCKSLVNFESRKGATVFLSLLESANITLPKVVKDKLIFFNYWRC